VDCNFLDIDPDTDCICHNCGWVGPFNECNSLIKDADRRIVPGEICPAGECPECGALVYVREQKPECKLGINPITIRTTYPGEKLNVTLGRIGLMLGDVDRSSLTIAIHPEDPKEGDPIVSQPIYEREFLNAIGHLFPNGELHDVHLKRS